jgi:DNA-binding winged helix-turn-helix (wHTH) protein
VKTGGIRGEPGLVRFDAFVLDPVRRQLTRDGEVLHLTPKAFDLLALLVDQAPRVVPKSELHERLWKETFVSDATLVGVVKELRRVLNDRSDDRPIIRTAHRIGYAFCRSVDDSTAGPTSVVAHWVLIDRRRIVLRAGENVIGRDPAAVVWLDSSAVSRRHARIVIDGRGVRLEDLGSKNGTRVGDHTVVGECALQDGDRITIGPTRLLYRTAAAGATTETRSPSSVRARPSSLDADDA